MLIIAVGTLLVFATGVAFISNDLISELDKLVDLKDNKG